MFLKTTILGTLTVLQWKSAHRRIYRQLMLDLISKAEKQSQCWQSCEWEVVLGEFGGGLNVIKTLYKSLK